MAAARPSAKPTASSSVRADGQPRDWVHELRSGGQDREAARARLRDALLAAARDEARRRWQGQAGPRRRRGGTEAEQGDLCTRAADSALKAISAELVRYRAPTRFTTWAYKYVMFGLSEAAGRWFWSGQPRPKEYDWKKLAALRPADLTAGSRDWGDTSARPRRAPESQSQAQT